MPVSVEARAIRANERLADVYICTTHLPDDGDVDLAALVSRLIGVPYSTVISESQLRSVFESAPRFVGGWSWETPGQLFTQFLRALALGNFAGGGATSVWDLPFDHPMMMEEFFFRRRAVVPSLGTTRSRLGLDLAWRMATPQGDGDEVQRVGLAQLLDYEVPFSHSPPLGGMTLRQIADKARYVVLLPLAAGASHTVEAVYKGEWTAAIMTAAASGGATLIFASTLWLADRLFGGVKHLDTPTQPPSKPRRKARET